VVRVSEVVSCCDGMWAIDGKHMSTNEAKSGMLGEFVLNVSCEVEKERVSLELEKSVGSGCDEDGEAYSWG